MIYPIKIFKNKYGKSGEFLTRKHTDLPNVPLGMCRNKKKQKTAGNHQNFRGEFIIKISRKL